VDIISYLKMDPIFQIQAMKETRLVRRKTCMGKEGTKPRHSFEELTSCVRLVTLLGRSACAERTGLA
jgi:hypothetical protein